MLLPARTVAPAAALLTAAEVKAHLRIEHADEDATIAALIEAVEAALDGSAGVLNRALVTQTWTQGYAGFAATMRLPLAPVQSATISYFDADGAEQALADAYRLHQDARGGYLRLIDGASAPATAIRDDAVTLTMVCGYGATAADVPADIRHAAKLLAGHFYEHREAVGVVQFHELPLAAQWLLERYRRVGV